jgi:rare lipoprotein A
MMLRIVLILILVILNGCTSRTYAPQKSPSPSAPMPSPQAGGGYYLDDGPGAVPPQNLDKITDAVPRDEALHRGANKPYTVMGKSYVPNVGVTTFRQSGVASWYGRKYHGQKTSMGETYDMYAMTGAHPTLPLPSYVRVTNQLNGKSVVVRVNDRGPFLQDRIIDLSYVAAHKLDFLRRGSAPVLIERVFAGDAAAAVALASSNTDRQAALPTAPLTPPPNTITTNPISAEEGRFYLQLGAFGAVENAESFRVRISAALDWNKEPIHLFQRDQLVRVRLGPVSTREQAEALAKRIRESLQLVPIISAY